ncbi:MAG: hypothetical protein ACYS0D_08320 [Planctomycetota bacterium]
MGEQASRALRAWLTRRAQVDTREQLARDEGSLTLPEDGLPITLGSMPISAHSAEDIIGKWVCERIRLRRVSKKKAMPAEVIHHAETVGETPPPAADGNLAYTSNAVKEWLVATLDNPDWG